MIIDEHFQPIRQRSSHKTSQHPLHLMLSNIEHNEHLLPLQPLQPVRQRSSRKTLKSNIDKTSQQNKTTRLRNQLSFLKGVDYVLDGGVIF